MKKLIKFIGLAAITVMTGFMFACPVLAAGDLAVWFEQTPLFQDANLLPGNSVTRWIKVTNNGSVAHKVSTDSANVSDPGHLGDALYLVIKENGNTLWTGTMTQFFGAHSIDLNSQLAPGAMKQYDYTVSFDLSSGNAYQTQSTGFDLIIGFIGGEEEGDGGGTFTIATSGGGGGLTTLTIFNENSGGVTENFATITWQTNLFSTSRVIYEVKNGDVPCAFDPLATPNFGFVNSTVEDGNLFTGHQVNLTGLLGDTTYCYRVISHIFPPETVGRSFTFKTAGKSTLPPGEQTPPTAPANENPTAPATAGQPGEVAGAAFEGTGVAAPEQGKVLGEAIASPVEAAALVAPVENASNCYIYIWILLILNLIAAGISGYLNRKSDKILIKNAWILIVLLVVIPVIIWYPQCWLTYWLAVILILAIISLILKEKTV